MARATFQVEVTCDIGTLDPQELMSHVEAAVRGAEGPGWTELVEIVGAGDEWTATVECTDAWSADDVVRCRVCGCTDDHACPGGCSWVPDPEMAGDLCSACLDAAGGDQLAATDPTGFDTRAEMEGKR